MQERSNAPPAIEASVPWQPNEHHVVHVAGVGLNPQVALHEVVNGIKVDERIQLTEEIADGNAQRRLHLRELHGNGHQPSVLDLALDEPPKDAPVDGIEEAAHIELENVALRSGAAHGTLHILARSVRAVTGSTRERRGDKCAIENRSHGPVDGMLHDGIPECWRVDRAQLGLADNELTVWLWLVSPVIQRGVQPCQLAAQATLEGKAGPLAPLAATRVQIGVVQRLLAERRVEKLSVSFHR